MAFCSCLVAVSETCLAASVQYSVFVSFLLLLFNSLMEVQPVECPDKARKKRKAPETWKRAREKKERYGPEGLPKKITCNHGKKGNAYRCQELTYNDQKYFHSRFYNTTKKSNELKMYQDSFILKYSETFEPKTCKIKNNARGKNKMSANYFVYKKSSKNRVRVCKKAFLATLRVKPNRLIGVLSRHFNTGDLPQEKRGGNRKRTLFSAKRNSVIAFIKKFNALESHYCRSKTTSRQYLTSDLNIKKMWRLYNAETQEEDQVKESYFRYIFNTNFNLGFGSLRTDECSTCLSLDERIKNCDDAHTKSNLMAQKRVHKLKSKAFYQLLKEKRGDLLTISFDCQKNQVLPKVPDQSAYYARQLYIYNLTIVVGDSKCKQTKDNVFIYYWTEDQHGKSANEIASAVFDCLNKLNIPETVKTIRLASDGCGGQNKNYFMMSMVAFWLLKKAPATVKKVEFVFPMVGHSYLPSDRVFGRIEKEIKRKPVIIEPAEYVEVFSHHGTVIPVYGCNRDWKSNFEVVRPPAQWHFKFNPSKRFHFKRSSKGKDVLIKGEVNYRTDLCRYKRFCKKGSKFQAISDPQLIATKTGTVSALKARDVGNLLEKHFGEDWKSLDTLRYYKNIVEGDQLAAEENQNDDVCQHLAEEGGLVI